MTAEQFAYWLQGRAELVAEPPSSAEWKSICEHLGTVFHKVTPTVGDKGIFDITDALRNRQPSPDIMTRRIC